MTWIDELAGDLPDTQMRSRLPRPLSGDDGTAYFQAIVEALGNDPERASRLSARWKLLAESEEARPWALRAKALLERSQGNWLKSVTEFARAADCCKDPVDHFRFQIGAVDSLGRAGRIRQAVELAEGLVEGLTAAGDLRSAALVQLNLGNAHLWHDNYGQARTAFESAIRSLEPGDPARSAALLGSATGCLFSGAPALALARALQALEGFKASGAPLHAAQAQVTIGQSHLLLGRPDEAATHFQEAQKDFEPDSLDFARSEEFLGDAYGRMNLWHEAELAFRAAESQPSLVQSRLNRGNVRLGLALVLEQKGRLSEAEKWAQAAITDYRAFGNEPWTAHAGVVLSRVRRSGGRLKSALRTAEVSLATLSRTKAKGLLVGAMLEVAECRMELGLDARAELANASRALRSSPAPAFEWRIPYLLAKSSPQDQRLRHFRRMSKAVFEARAMTKSTLARASFLNDKADALRLYLSELLSRQDSRSIREALNVVAQSRSSVLLDEILSADLALDAPWRQEFEAVRTELSLASAIGDDGQSRMAVRSAEWRQVRRKWTEVMIRARSEVSLLASAGMAPDLTLVETAAGSFAITGDKAKKLPVSSTQLEEDLGWLRFELLSPMSDRTSDPGPALDALAHLADRLQIEVKRHGTVICPDGVFWNVPWGALFGLEGHEAVLALGPWVSKESAKLGGSPKAAVWFHDHPNLPHVLKEVEDFVRYFPDALVCGSAQEVRECLKLGRFDLVHVAGHASSLPEHPQFSALHFRDGDISAAEISRSTMRPKIVVLAACVTGAVSSIRPAEPEGLARSFLALGSSAVLTSLWPLDDEAASIFMYPFYSSLQGGSTIVDAAIVGRRAVRDRFEHPYYWGPFSLYGGY